MQKLVGVAAVTSKAVATLLLTAAVLQRASTAAVISLVQSLIQFCFRNDTVHNSNAGASSD